MAIFDASRHLHLHSFSDSICGHHNHVTEMKDIEKIIAELNSLGYMVENVWQAVYTGINVWHFSFRSPYKWCRQTVKADTFIEAATKALQLARQLGPAHKAVNPPKRRVRLTTGKRRVRLTRRVRLKGNQ